MLNPDRLLVRLKARLAPEFWEILDRASQLARERQWHLYIVGGIVRDLLLLDRGKNDSLNLPDIDLSVDRAPVAATPGAGIELATALQKHYPQTRLEVFSTFQTATLVWQGSDRLNSFSIDFATARTETYAYPGANPQVQASSIREDLYRRDFTVNAFAVRLTHPDRGELLDFFDGLTDLGSRHLRVLHEKSFIDDPTRMYRGARFAVRFGFEFDLHAQRLIQDAISSGIYARTLAERDKVPALQTRMQAELRYTLGASYSQAALTQLAALNALQCLHPTLSLDDRSWWHLRWVSRAWQRLDESHRPSLWLTRLEVILAGLAPEFRESVAQNLQLPDDSQHRLKNLDRLQKTFAETLPQCDRPSQVVRCLQAYHCDSLWLVMVTSPRRVRHKIWQYLTQWQAVKPPLNGKDLQQMGYRPGPHFRTILEALKAALVDGEIEGDTEDEIRNNARLFVLNNYHL
ncbi:CCA tRNA nucleotidyltransferase [Oscillatoriales cyanobacterium LEGE 11467]|uniref:CCA tRNA nucleotidyltransferase n=1 Tax=Zarconia navalis LEGE 11467 TaxID=1828826 RepID=A0A928W1H4_9CYAN|nr:hypothetical protein [Zarconia navalis]MBE9042797.1 CCA tRNA nucleotidyltransferase [Zarconia navalis LEGE 11467]